MRWVLYTKKITYFCINNKDSSIKCERYCNSCIWKWTKKKTLHENEFIVHWCLVKIAVYHSHWNDNVPHLNAYWNKLIVHKNTLLYLVAGNR